MESWRLDRLRSTESWHTCTNPRDRALAPVYRLIVTEIEQLSRYTDLYKKLAPTRVQIAPRWSRFDGPTFGMMKFKSYSRLRSDTLLQLGRISRVQSVYRHLLDSCRCSWSLGSLFHRGRVNGRLVTNKKKCNKHRRTMIPTGSGSGTSFSSELTRERTRATKHNRMRKRTTVLGRRPQLACRWGRATLIAL